MASTQADSHGAGQMRPVNSGKLLVACSWTIASCQLVAVDEVVPVGDQVAERAALVAERDAAVHAARALLAQLLLGRRLEVLLVVAHALAGSRLSKPTRWILQEAAQLSHGLGLRRLSGRWLAARRPLGRPRARRARACSRAASPSRSVARPRPSRRAAAAPPASRCARRARRPGPCSSASSCSASDSSSTSSGLQRRRKSSVLVVDVGDAAAHAGGEVAPGRAEHDDAAAGHVLAAVVADALDDRVRARVAHGEALAREPAEERAAAGGAVEHGVADDHVLLGREAGVLGGRTVSDAAGRGPCRRSRCARPRA